MKAQLFAFLFSTFGFTLSVQAQVKDVKRHPVVYPKGVKKIRHTSAAGNPKKLPSSKKRDNPMRGVNMKLKPAAAPQALSPEERKKRLPSNSKPSIVIPTLPTTNSKT